MKLQTLRILFYRCSSHDLRRTYRPPCDNHVEGMPEGKHSRFDRFITLFQVGLSVISHYEERHLKYEKSIRTSNAKVSVIIFNRPASPILYPSLFVSFAQGMFVTFVRSTAVLVRLTVLTKFVAPMFPTIKLE